MGLRYVLAYRALPPMRSANARDLSIRMFAYTTIENISNNPVNGRDKTPPVTLQAGTKSIYHRTLYLSFETAR